MEEKNINNIYLFLIGVGLNLVALVLLLIPSGVKEQLIANGLSWGGWWSFLVEAAPLIMVIIGVYIIQRSKGQW